MSTTTARTISARIVNSTTARRVTAAAIACAAGTGVALGQASDASAAQESTYDIPSVQPARIGQNGWHSDTGQYPKQPAMMGAMECDPGNPDGMTPVAARSWAYYDDTVTDNDDSADVSVTGWTSGAAALKAVTNDGTHCTLLAGWRPVGGGEYTRLFTDGAHAYAVVVQVGNLLVSVRTELPHAGLAAAKKQAVANAAKVAGKVLVNYPAAAG